MIAFGKDFLHFLYSAISGGHTLMVFSGGMPRASHGDHHTVTVMHGTKHVVYDFTSKVVDFFTICSAEELHAHSKSGSLLCSFLQLTLRQITVSMLAEIAMISKHNSCTCQLYKAEMY